MSVVSIEQYRQQTRDIVTSDAEVASALVESQGMIEDYLRRELEEAERTEVVVVATPSGFVYPSVTPVTAVSNPSDAQIIDEQYLTAMGDNYPDASGFSAWLNDGTSWQGRSQRTRIVYTGGWTPLTLPTTLRRAIIDVIGVLMSGSTPFVAGAQSVSLGDASVSFGAAAPIHPIDQLVPGLTQRIRSYQAR